VNPQKNFLFRSSRSRDQHFLEGLTEPPRRAWRFTARYDGKTMEVHMSQYDNYRDDEIIDQVDQDYPPGRSGSFNNDGVGTGLGVGALTALAIILLIAWNMGYLQIKPYEGSTHVTDLPISPPLVPSLPSTPPPG
jgi:hypothetical protein